MDFYRPLIASPPVPTKLHPTIQTINKNKISQTKTDETTDQPTKMTIHDDTNLNQDKTFMEKAGDAVTHVKNKVTGKGPAEQNAQKVGQKADGAVNKVGQNFIEDGADKVKHAGRDMKN